MTRASEMQLIIGQCAECETVQTLGVLPTALTDVITMMGKPCGSCGGKRLRMVNIESLVRQWRDVLIKARMTGAVQRDMDTLLQMIESWKSEEGVTR